MSLARAPCAKARRLEKWGEVLSEGVSPQTSYLMRGRERKASARSSTWELGGDPSCLSVQWIVLF